MLSQAQYRIDLNSKISDIIRTSDGIYPLISNDRGTQSLEGTIYHKELFKQL